MKISGIWSVADKIVEKDKITRDNKILPLYMILALVCVDVLQKTQLLMSTILKQLHYL